jgi:hypothetical protein
MKSWKLSQYGNSQDAPHAVSIGPEDSVPKKGTLPAARERAESETSGKGGQ